MARSPHPVPGARWLIAGARLQEQPRIAVPHARPRAVPPRRVNEYEHALRQRLQRYRLNSELIHSLPPARGGEGR